MSEVSVKPVSLMFVLVLGVAVGLIMSGVGNRYAKSDDALMIYYAVDSAMLINTLSFSPGVVMVNYVQDMSKYNLEDRGNQIVVFEKKPSSKILGELERKFHFGRDTHIPILTENLGEVNYFYKSHPIIFTSEKKEKIIGFSCPSINTTETRPIIILNPLTASTSSADGFAYDILNILVMSGFDSDVKPVFEMTNIRNGKDRDILYLQRKIDEKKADMLISSRFVSDKEDFIVAYVPLYDPKSSKFACILLNRISFELDYPSNIVIIPSDEDLIRDTVVDANIVLEFHSANPDSNIYTQQRDTIIRSLKESITLYYGEE